MISIDLYDIYEVENIISFFNHGTVTVYRNCYNDAHWDQSSIPWPKLHIDLYDIYEVENIISFFNPGTVTVYCNRSNDVLTSVWEDDEDIITLLSSLPSGRRWTSSHYCPHFRLGGQ